MPWAPIAGQTLCRLWKSGNERAAYFPGKKWPNCSIQDKGFILVLTQHAQMLLPDCWMDISPHRTEAFTFLFLNGGVLPRFWIWSSFPLLCFPLWWAFFFSLPFLFISFIFQSQQNKEQPKEMISHWLYRSGLAPITLFPTTEELEVWSELELLYCATWFPWSVMNKNKLLLLR